MGLFQHYVNKLYSSDFFIYYIPYDDKIYITSYSMEIEFEISSVDLYYTEIIGIWDSIINNTLRVRLFYLDNLDLRKHFALIFYDMFNPHTEIYTYTVGSVDILSQEQVNYRDYAPISSLNNYTLSILNIIKNEKGVNFEELADELENININ